MTDYFLAFKGSARKSAHQQGFSLIEIMVVVVIMGVLAALVVPNVMDRPDQARIIAAKQDIGAIMQALKLYRLDNGRYPPATEGLEAFVAKNDKGLQYRSEEHTSELQSLMRSSYAVFCWKKKNSRHKHQGTIKDIEQLPV